MKRVVFCLIITMIVVIVPGCSSKNKEKEELKDNDLTAYNMALEICYKADDPASVKIISGYVATESQIGVFRVSTGNQVYNILVSYEDGEAVCEKLLDEVIDYENTREMLYSTDNFNIKAVNKKLNEKWNN